MISLIEMEVAIASLFNPRRCLIVPNIHWGFQIHECDLLIVKKSGYAVEVEIKRSVSDLRADAKKRHAHHDKQNRIKELYYAVPIELLEKCRDLIPEDAGIISVSPNRVAASIERQAKAMKCRKLTDKECYDIARLGTLRIWKLKQKVIKLNDNLKNIKDIKKIYLQM